MKEEEGYDILEDGDASKWWMVSIYFAAVYPLPEEDVHHFYEEGGREESLRWRGNANGAKNVDKKKKEEEEKMEK